MPPIINKARCVKCSLCAAICPLDVIHVSEKTGDICVMYPDECWHCRACVIECPKEAIRLRYPPSHMMFTMTIPDRGETL